MKEKRVCFYHSADLDGHCSGAIVKYAHPETELVGINYGDDYEEKVFSRVDKNTIVYMVDFCLQPFSLMERLSIEGAGLIWIDHHKTAIEDSYRSKVYSFNGVRDENYAACELVWRWFNPPSPMPKAVHLLSRYDIWKWQDVPDALEFQFGMRLEDTDPANNMHIWKELFRFEDIFIPDIIKQGRTVLRYQKQHNKKYAKSTTFELNWKGYNWIASNAQLTNSQLFDSVYDETKHDGMLAFGWKKNKWVVSLYTTQDDVDCGGIAKSMGGGGHKQAAGFTCKDLPFEL